MKVEITLPPDLSQEEKKNWQKKQQNKIEKTQISETTIDSLVNLGHFQDDVPTISSTVEMIVLAKNSLEEYGHMLEEYGHMQNGNKNRAISIAKTRLDEAHFWLLSIMEEKGR